MNIKQTTIKNEILLEGKGLHTGKNVNLTLKPAEENYGIKFVRTDLTDTPVIEADSKYVKATKRGTTLEKNGVNIHTTEHLLAAIYGLQIDNIIIEINAEEIPIMDGSSISFVDVIEKADIVKQNSNINYFEVKEPVTLKDDQTGSEIIILPSDTYQVNVMVDFDTKVLGTQNASISHISEFKDKISKSRTFSFLHELEPLLDNNLIKGGDLDNAIIYVDKDISENTFAKLEKAFNKKGIVVEPNGILNNTPLRYDNEVARHKLLDVIGDLALIGKKIKGKIIANKPGHYINTQFAKKMSKIISKDVFKYDPNSPVIKDINGIKRMLPHRYPFLLIDKIVELTEDRVVGIKNVTMNEPFFIGHFPTEPVMPGVLQIEAMAQTGGILVLSTVPDPENYLTYFLKIDNVKFKNKVIPGDTLMFDIKLMAPIRRGICQVMAKAYVGNKLVSEAKLVAQIVKSK